MAEGIRQGGVRGEHAAAAQRPPPLVPAISMTTQAAGGGGGRAGVLFRASAITAADVAAKAANVTLIEVRIGYAIGGKGFVTLTGDVGAVREAVAAASRSGAAGGHLRHPAPRARYSSPCCKRKERGPQPPNCFESWRRSVSNGF